MERRQTGRGLRPGLTPPYEIDVLKQYLHLAADQEPLKRRVLDVDIGDVDFLDLVGFGVEVCERLLNVLQLSAEGQPDDVTALSIRFKRFTRSR